MSDQGPRPVRVYSAEAEALQFGKVLREMVRGIRTSHYTAYRLAIRTIKGQYSTTALGMLWDFLDPLVLALIFYFLRSQDVFATGELAMPYSIYTTYGLFMYATFQQAAMQSVNSFEQAGGLLRHQKLYPEAILMSVLYRVGFFSIFRIAVMLLFSFYTGAFVVVGLGKFLVLFPLLILAGMAIGVFLAPFNAVYRDVGRALGIILVPLRFVSPVLFVLPESPFWNTFNMLNGFGLVVTNLRLLATSNQVTDVGPTLIHLALFGVVGFVGWFVYHVSMPIISERV